MNASQFRQISGWLIAFTLSCVYLFLELRWNAQLLRALGGSASPEEVTSVINAGKLLTSFGIAWGITRSLVAGGAIPFRRAALVVSLATLVVWSALDATYKLLPGWVPRERAVQSFELMALHQGLRKGEVAQPELSAAANDPLATAFWGVLLFDKEAEKGADKEAEKGAEVAFAGSRRSLEKQVQRDAVTVYRATQAEVRKKLNGATPERVRGEFQRAYQRYKQASNEISETKFFFARQGAEKRMRDQFGLSPSTLATEEMFAKQAAGSHHGELRNLARAWLALNGHSPQLRHDRVLAEKQGVRITVGDVLSRTEPQFVLLVKERFGEAADDLFPSESTVRESSKISAVVAAVILAPVSMTLSAIGILANLGVLLALSVQLAHKARPVQLLAAACPVVVVCAGFALAPAHTPPGFGKALADMPAGFAVQRAIGLQTVLSRSAHRLQLG